MYTISDICVGGSPFHSTSSDRALRTVCIPPTHPSSPCTSVHAQEEVDDGHSLNCHHSVDSSDYEGDEEEREVEPRILGARPRPLKNIGKRGEKYSTTAPGKRPGDGIDKLAERGKKEDQDSVGAGVDEKWGGPFARGELAVSRRSASHHGVRMTPGTSRPGFTDGTPESTRSSRRTSRNGSISEGHQSPEDEGESRKKVKWYDAALEYYSVTSTVSPSLKSKHLGGPAPSMFDNRSSTPNDLATAQPVGRQPQLRYTSTRVGIPTNNGGLFSPASTVSQNPTAGDHGLSTNKRKPGPYKTEPCRNWEERGACRYGNECRFAHGEEELRGVLQHSKHRMEICRVRLSSASFMSTA